MTINDKFLEGIRLFNEEKFFEAHDLWEELWVEDSGEDTEFVRGFIHIAVGCYHLRNQNFRGAKSQLLKGFNKLSEHKPEISLVNLESFLSEIERLILTVEKLIQGQITSDKEIKFPKLSVQKD